MSNPQGIDDPARFPIGSHVWWERANRLPAVVVGHTRRRVLIEVRSRGRLVVRKTSAYLLSPRQEGGSE